MRICARVWLRKSLCLRCEPDFTLSSVRGSQEQKLSVITVWAERQEQCAELPATSPLSPLQTSTKTQGLIDFMLCLYGKHLGFFWWFCAIRNWISWRRRKGQFDWIICGWNEVFGGFVGLWTFGVRALQFTAMIFSDFLWCHLKARRAAASSCYGKPHHG